MWKNAKAITSGNSGAKPPKRREYSMSHHSSGPDFRFPRGDARLDMTDFYAFPKPEDPGKSIIILNVHPSYSVNPPGPTTTEPFAPRSYIRIED